MLGLSLLINYYTWNSTRKADFVFSVKRWDTKFSSKQNIFHDLLGVWRIKDMVKLQYFGWKISCVKSKRLILTNSPFVWTFKEFTLKLHSIINLDGVRLCFGVVTLIQIFLFPLIISWGELEKLRHRLNTRKIQTRWECLRSHNGTEKMSPTSSQRSIFYSTSNESWAKYFNSYTILPSITIKI